MNHSDKHALDRRKFFFTVGAASTAAIAAPHANALAVASTERNAPARLQTGNGEWTYEVDSGWGQLPAGHAFGGTHGGIATDTAGHVYVSTQSETGILVYSPNGGLL